MKNNQIKVPYVEDSIIEDAADISYIIEETGTRNTIDSLNWEKYRYHPLTTFSMAHSEKYLYVDFFVRCNYLRGFYDKTNSPVEEDSCVAIYLQQGDSDEYYALSFNCIGAVKGEIVHGDGSRELMQPESLDTIMRVCSVGNRPFRELEGLFSWNVAVRIPLELLGIEVPVVTPLVLKGNFYKCAASTSQSHYLSWCPVDTAEPDFYRPESFGTIVLE